MDLDPIAQVGLDLLMPAAPGASRTRVALLGGSFNPPHLAHQMACLWVLSSGLADEVWLMPAFRHPFGKDLESFEHRQEMCRLAAAVFRAGAVQVSRAEAELDSDGRTLHTIQHLVGRYPEHAFELLVGADIMAEKDSWYRFDLIESLVPVLVVGRSGYESPEGTISLPPISSSEVRRRLGAGEDISSLVPCSVRAYIETHGLYKTRSG